jgi:FKBP-type peptidyl-prolyl cis-trans isomerase FkpA
MNKLKIVTGLSMAVMLCGNVFGQSTLTEGFSKTSRGLYYKIIVDNKQPKGKVDDKIKMNIIYSTQRDSVLYSSYTEGTPGQLNIGAPAFNGDPMEGFAMLGTGDSAIFLIPEDSIYKNQEMPPFARKGEFLKVHVKVLFVMTKEEYEKKRDEEMKTQSSKEAQTIEEYLAKNNLHAQKTPSGLYYIVQTQGTGPKAEAGKTVTVNYTGKLLDGKVFDSSLKPGRTPFDFKLGAGQVIKGWDEGIALFNVGGKGTLIIPSPMGYGSRASGPIPANSILIFDIEVLDIK